MPTGMKLRTARPFNVDDVTAPFGQAFGATFDDTLTAGRELYDYVDRNFQESYDKQLGRISTTYLTPEEANSQIGDLPLSIDDRISQERLDKLIASKKKEIRADSIIARADEGFLTQAGLFGAGLASTLTDPLEVGLSFIPIVGQVKYARLLESAGSNALARAGVRAEVGVIEGTAGALISEPFIQAGARDRQADYTMYDSLTNIVFGGLIGGGLHMGAGAIKDRYFRPTGTAKLIDDVSGETRVTAFDTAMKQSNEGYIVNIDHILKSDPNYVYSTGKIVSDVPESVNKKKVFDGSTEESVRIYNDVLSKSVSEIKSKISKVKGLSKGELKSITGEVKNLKYDISKKESQIKGRSKNDLLYKGLTKQVKDSNIRLKELEDVLDSNSVTKVKTDELSQKLDEIINNPEKFDINDYPPELRTSVNQNLKEVHAQRSPMLIKNLVNDYKANNINKSKYSPTEHELQSINKRHEEAMVSDNVKESLIDEAIDDMKKDAELLGIKDDIDTIDATVKTMESEADELDKALKEFSLCKVING